MSETIRAIVIMGVSGSGKSTVASALCARTGAYMIEGDTFHPASSVQKMAAGVPLTDSDRQGWLERLAQEVRDRLQTNPTVVLSCSALKRHYRDVLRQATPNLGFVYLALTPDEATQRVSSRSDHFMPASLVTSQFHDLEPPRDEPLVLTISATLSIDDITDQAVRWWSEHNDTP